MAANGRQQTVCFLPRKVQMRTVRPTQCRHSRGRVRAALLAGEKRVTECSGVAKKPDAMFSRLPLDSARRLAALLLLLGVMLGGTVDAVACEPTTEVTVLVIAVDDQDGDHQQPGGVHDSECIHGHCHHVVPIIQPTAVIGDVLGDLSNHPMPGDRRLASIDPNTLRRPPRA